MDEKQVCNEQVFSELYELHSNDLYNFLTYKFGDSELANDSLQEAFIKLWDNCAKVAFSKAKSFLFTVAKNKTIDSLRSNKPMLEVKEEISFSDNISPEKAMIEQQLKGQMLKILEEMPENQRVPFLLNRIEGKKYAEIAEMLDISVKAVEKRMSKALKYIKERKESLDLW